MYKSTEEYKAEYERLRKAEESTLAWKINHSVDLTDDEKQSLFDLLAEYCRSTTRERLHRVIFNYGIHNHAGLYSRVSFVNGKAQYCAGQSYPDEIRELRKCILEAW